MTGRFAIPLACAFLLGAPAGAWALTGDAVRGARVHDLCLGCHGTEVYVPPKREVKSMAELRREVDRWNRSMNPRLTKQQVEDVVAYLNGSFYRFPP